MQAPPGVIRSEASAGRPYRAPATSCPLEYARSRETCAPRSPRSREARDPSRGSESRRLLRPRASVQPWPGRALIDRSDVAAAARGKHGEGARDEPQDERWRWCRPRRR
jgi:hypothetical protein